MKKKIILNIKDYIACLKESDPYNLLRTNQPIIIKIKSAKSSSIMNEKIKENTQDSLTNIAKVISSCTKCPLNITRTKTVPGKGSSCPEIIFIGEGPGHDEDLQGEPFVGPAGKLLTRLINKMGFNREDVFITNVVKCRPTVDYAMVRDRPPNEEEMQTCLPYLIEQIKIINPKVIVLLGNVALKGLFGLTGITRLHGKWLKYQGIDTMPAYHPSYLLRNGGEDKHLYWEMWHDMLLVLERLGRKL